MDDPLVGNPGLGKLLVLRARVCAKGKELIYLRARCSNIFLKLCNHRTQFHHKKKDQTFKLV